MMRPSPSGRCFAIVLPISLLLLGAIFRLSGLARDFRLHPDEAHYADLARRIGIWGDWQLLYYPTDKPPLFHFVGAMFLRLVGDSEFTVRLPNAFASLITLALLYILVKDLTGKLLPAGLAVLLVALSPMEIALASSGFADTQMMMWVMLAMVLITRKRWTGSGWAMGLAVITKPTALWMSPLVLAIGWQVDSAIIPRKLWLWGRGILLLIFLITLWDFTGEPYGVWSNGAGNNLPRQLISLDETAPRLNDWMVWIKYLFPYPIFFLIVALVIFFLIRGRLFVGTDLRVCPFLESLQKDRHAGLSLQHPRFPLELIFAGFGLSYFLIHWLIPFNIYDRYLLPLIPMIAIAMALVLGRFTPRFQMMVATLILLVGVMVAWNAGMGRSPVASDLGKHQGIDQLAQVMNSDYAGEVFYEHYLGWELRYYLTADPQVIVVWFESPDALVDYARKRDRLAEIGVPRYFVGFKSEAAPWIESIERHGLETQLSYDDGRYVIYALTE